MVPGALQELPGFANTALFWRVQTRFHRTGSRAAVVLYRALTVAERMVCSDLHDKLFAVLGITKISGSENTERAGHELLQPDYLKSIARIYRDATRFCIIQSGRLDALLDVTHRDDGDLEMNGRPSWVIDLDRRHTSIADPEELWPISSSNAMLDNLSTANLLWQLEGCFLGLTGS